MKIFVGVQLNAVLAVALLSVTMAQLHCDDMVAALTPCIDYVSGGTSAPSSECCNQLRDVVQTKPRCLCQVQNQGVLNKTRVLGLPGECMVPVPPTSGCNSPPGSPNTQTPPSPASGYGTRVSCSLQLSLILVASLAKIFTI